MSRTLSDLKYLWKFDSTTLTYNLNSMDAK